MTLRTCRSKTSLKVQSKSTLQLLTVLLLVCGIAGHAQGGQPTALHFDAVSIKANHTGQSRGLLEISPDGDRVVVTNSPMYRILAFAYNRQRSDLIVGLPEWAREERWDIEATIASSDLRAFHALTFVQQKAMLQSVLAERCKMQVHFGKKEVPVYALVLAKGGSKMHEEKPPDPAEPAPGWNFTQKAGEVHARVVPLAALLYILSGASLGRQVIDRTSLTGVYDFDLLWTPQDELDAHAGSSEADAGSSAPPNPSIFTALPEQLGLLLEPTRALVEALIADHIERPSSN
jgi:uncharacterized protein (TIGR03435 family)